MKFLFHAEEEEENRGSTRHHDDYDEGGGGGGREEEERTEVWQSSVTCVPEGVSSGSNEREEENERRGREEEKEPTAKTEREREKLASVSQSGGARRVYLKEIQAKKTKIRKFFPFPRSHGLPSPFFLCLIALGALSSFMRFGP